MTQKWTYDACYEEAKKYTTIQEFRENNESCYISAWNKDWLKDYTWLKHADGGHGIWTKEEVIEEAKKYKALDDFHKNNLGAYTSAWRNGWLKELIWLERRFNEHTFEEFVEAVSKYDSIKDFRENESKLYSYAEKHKWLDTKEFKSLLRISKPNGYWTKERCAEKALLYNTISEFNRKEPSAYNAARRNEWLKEITTHMKTSVTPEEMYRMNHVIYVYKDEINHYAYVGLTNNLYVRHSSHCDKNKKDTLYRHFEKFNLEIPEPEIVYSDLTPHEAQEKEREVFYQYRDAGWNMINDEKALGSLGSTKKKWTFNKTYNEAKKYKTKKEFREKCPGGFVAARKYHYMKEFTWFISQWEQKRIWDYQTTYNEAKKYKRNKDFREQSQNAYTAACRNGWIKDYIWLIRLCETNKWTYEVCYKEAQKYKYLKDFRKYSNGAYNAAIKKKWINDYTWLQRCR